MRTARIRLSRAKLEKLLKGEELTVKLPPDVDTLIIQNQDLKNSEMFTRIFGLKI